MFYSLLGCDSFVRIVCEKLYQDIFEIVRTSRRQKLLESDSFFQWKVDLHVRGLSSKPIKNFRFRCTYHVMNTVNLIEFVFSRKKRFLCDKLKKDASESPYVHFFIVVSIGHQALRSTIPSGRNIIGVGSRTVFSFARTQIGYFDQISLD